MISQGYSYGWKLFYKWMIGSDLPLEDKDISGIYILFNLSRPVYVGKAKKVYWRVFQHSSVRNSDKADKFNTFIILPIKDSNLRTIIEKLLIYAIDPPLNKTKPKVVHLLEAELNKGTKKQKKTK